jgi:hypothetical protein
MVSVPSVESTREEKCISQSRRNWGGGGFSWLLRKSVIRSVQVPLTSAGSRPLTKSRLLPNVLPSR